MRPPERVPAQVGTASYRALEARRSRPKRGVHARLWRAGKGSRKPARRSQVATLPGVMAATATVAYPWHTPCDKTAGRSLEAR